MDLIKLSWARIAGLCVLLTATVFILATRSRQYESIDHGDLSLVRLLCNPKAHDKEVVSTGGFLDASSSYFQEAVLYMHEDDCRYNIQKNAIFVSLPKELLRSVDKINHRYVWIEGRYSTSCWDRRAFSGSLSEVSKLSVLPCLFGIGPTNALMFAIDKDGNITKKTWPNGAPVSSAQ